MVAIEVFMEGDDSYDGTCVSPECLHLILKLSLLSFTKSSRLHPYLAYIPNSTTYPGQDTIQI